MPLAIRHQPIGVDFSHLEGRYRTGGSPFRILAAGVADIWTNSSSRDGTLQ